MQIKLNPEIIYVASANQLNVTSIFPENNEIFVFTGPSIQVLKHIFEKKEFNLDSATASALLGETLTEEELSPLLNFCLEKKIFIPS